jgi:hypothetical protein
LFIRGLCKIAKKTISFAMSVRPSAWNNLALTERIFMICDISVFFETLLREFKFEWNQTRITSTLHGDLFTFITISLPFLLRMRCFRQNLYRRSKHPFYVQYIIFQKSYRFLGNAEKYGRAGQATVDNMIQHMPSAFWINKATDTHSEYVLPIFSTAKVVMRTRLSHVTCSTPVLHRSEFYFLSCGNHSMYFQEIFQNFKRPEVCFSFYHCQAWTRIAETGILGLQLQTGTETERRNNPVTSTWHFHS